VPINPEELTAELQRMQRRIQEARNYLKFDELKKRITVMEARTGEADFWGDAAVAQEHMRTLNRIKNTVNPWEKLGAEVSDAVELSGMIEGDHEMERQLLAQAEEFDVKLEALETRALMKEPEDINDAYLYIHAGAGGTESCDWASMLMRMYTRWCEKSGYPIEQIELIDGEEAGVRSVTLLVKGEYAYGQLKSESGVHRLVRISPFDSAKRRHTSFCSVYAWPVVDDSIEVDIKDEDCKIDAFRAGGAGGQHVNKTSSAIRITHLPTKIVVQCQNERSQAQNKAQAFKMLRSRLYQYYLDQQKAEQAVKEDAKRDISWGNQIRSYVFQPYQLVKDHRTGFGTGNIPAVMDGSIDGFIEAWLRWNAGMGPAGDVGDIELD
jgi:peptide chain release factor 2